jgi:hypothetical protein
MGSKVGLDTLEGKKFIASAGNRTKVSSVDHTEAWLRRRPSYNDSFSLSNVK